jgi:DNA-binding transcriptional MerR regulator
MADTTYWTLDQLTAAVERALAVDYVGPTNGRVRDVPDQRTIRYYTTLGLIDRPAAMRGRTALYGRRHLLQLVSIKRLQSAGLTLAEVQARLLGRTDADLAEIAQLPADLGEPGASAPGCSPEPGADAPGSPQEERFWSRQPAPVPRPLVGVPLAEGLTLLFTAARPPDDHDLSALREAAQPLLDVLRRRRLLPRQAPSREESP